MDIRLSTSKLLGLHVVGDIQQWFCSQQFEEWCKQFYIWFFVYEHGLLVNANANVLPLKVLSKIQPKPCVRIYAYESSVFCLRAPSRRFFVHLLRTHVGIRHKYAITYAFTKIDSLKITQANMRQWFFYSFKLQLRLCRLLYWPRVFRQNFPPRPIYNATRFSKSPGVVKSAMGLKTVCVPPRVPKRKDIFLDYS